MTWLIPGVGAAILASLLVAFIFGYLYSREKEPALAYWAASWALYSLRFFVILGLAVEILVPGWLIVQQGVSLASVVLFVFGTHLFLVRPFSLFWVYGAVACLVWTLFSHAMNFSFVAVDLPSSLFIGSGYAWTGFAVLRFFQGNSGARRIAGIALIFWGLHKADYPFLRPVEWFAPWGFVLASLLFMLSGLGILLLYYERSRDRLQREIREKQESETRFRNVIESSHDAIILADAAGTVLLANRGALLMFGYTGEEMRAISLTRLMPERYRDDHLAGMNRVLARKESEYLGRTNIFYGLRRDGSEFPLELNVSHWRNEDGDFFSAIIRDVTARVRAEKEVVKSHALFRAVVDGVNDAIFIKDLEGRYLMANQATLDALGKKSAEVIGRTDAQLFPPHSNEVIRNTDQEVISQGKTVLREEHLATASGETVWLANKTPYRDSDGTIIGLIGISRDITAIREADRTVREREKLLTDVFDSIQDGITVLDHDMTIIRVNHAMEKMFPDQLPLQGKKCHMVYHGKNEPCDFCPSHKALASGKLEKAEIPWVVAGERKGTMELFSFPLRDEAGQTTGLVEYCRDITALKEDLRTRRRLEGQLRQAQKMEAIGTLAGGIAHDFNNILTPILAYTEMVREDLPEGGTAHQDLGEVLRAANRAVDLVRQILTFSREREQELMPLELAPTVKESIKLLKASLPSNIEIHQEVPATPLVILADPTQIHQVVMNLCTNAYQAMREQGGILTVALGKKVIEVGESLPGMKLGPGTYLELVVADTGIGMKQEVLERIFEPYFTTRKQEEGTGLGLAVVHGIVKGLGGDISVQSVFGQGSTFHVYLPLLDREDVEKTEAAAETLPRGTERILVVDDELPIVEIMVRNLTSLGYRVTSKVSSVEALESFRAGPDGFDLVVTDQTMPNMTGDHLAYELMHIRPDIPVILCTGFSSVINEAKAIKQGIRGFLFKPVTKRDIAFLIRKILDG